MTKPDYTSEAATLANLQQMKAEGEKLAQAYKNHREDLRAEAIHAVTEQGLSVAKVAATAGVDRRTLTVWLQVHNAGQKALKKQA